MKTNKKERKIRIEYQKEKNKKLYKKRKKRKKLGHMAAPVHNIDLKYFVDFIYFWRSNKKQRSCDGRGGAQRPVWGGNELKKTGARSARARTRGQNPLVNHIFTLGTLSVCVCVTVCVGTLCYSFSFSNQTDQGDEREGLKREGLKRERWERDR